jgi:GNAT superfamily N-acetyltransferase
MDTGKLQISQALVGKLEQVEIEAWKDFYNSAPRDALASCGVKLIRVSSGFFFIASGVDTLALNRVIGLGVIEPLTEKILDKAIAFYKEAHAPRFFIQLHPDVVTPEIKQMLDTKGFQHHNNWVKMYRDTTPLPPLETNMRVEEITSKDAPVFATIFIRGFEWSDFLQSWAQSVVGRRGWRHYLAYDGAAPVATGAFFTWGQHAWVDFASTLPQARGRGAQAVLVARRIADAKQAGCNWLVVETAEDTAKRPAPSFRNMIRYGFQVAYVRPNYVYYCDKGDGK